VGHGTQHSVEDSEIEKQMAQRARQGGAAHS
jgi:hypothetical protein